jgi:hypothetical protein
VILDAELLLGPAVLALYLKDCALLLQRDEALLVQGWGGRWRAAFGLRGWRLAGREPYLCHPFRPHEAVWRLRWDAARWPATPGTASAGLPALLAAFVPWGLAIWLALFLFLPLAFYGRLGLPTLIADLAVLYALIAGSLCLAWRHRAALGMDGRAFGVFAFELLACPPYAANLVRRLSMLRRADEDFGHAAERLLQGEALAQARIGCRLRVEEELEAIDGASTRAAALRAARDRLAAGDAAKDDHVGQ